MSDWAEEKAREWLEQDVRRFAHDDMLASLAALLRKVQADASPSGERVIRSLDAFLAELKTLPGQEIRLRAIRERDAEWSRAVKEGTNEKHAFHILRRMGIHE